MNYRIVVSTKQISKVTKESEHTVFVYFNQSIKLFRSTFKIINEFSVNSLYKSYKFQIVLKFGSRYRKAVPILLFSICIIQWII